MKKLLSRIWQQPSRARKQSTVKRAGEGSLSRKPRTYIPLRNCTKMGVVLPIKAPKQPPPLGSCTGSKADILQFDAHRGVMASLVIICLRSSVWFVGENVKMIWAKSTCTRLWHLQWWRENAYIVSTNQVSGRNSLAFIGYIQFANSIIQRFHTRW